ncbi:hypothetical protein DITRI_Ditri11bG0024000 [Diplodiscus trichospermus]
MWTKHSDFLALVKDSWSHEIDGSPIQQFIGKLKRLKFSLKKWNKEVFDNIHDKVKELQSDLCSIQSNIMENPNEDLLTKESCISKKLEEALLQQEVYYKEQSRIKWLAEGDSNTAFSQSVVNRRKASKGISYLKINGEIVDDAKIMEDHVLDYYSSLFKDPSGIDVDQDIIQDIIPSLVTNEDNNMLIVIPNEEEIKGKVFAMDANSALGPDGFGGTFCKHCLEYYWQ